MSEKFLIWSNEHNAWWRPAHSGYTRHVENAGRYDLEEAIKVCNGANIGWDMQRDIPFELPITESAALLLSKPMISKDEPRRLTGEQIAAMVKHAGVRHIVIRHCSMCNYPLSYLFDGDSVRFDSGCDCVTYHNVQQRSWRDLADHYNRQGNVEYKQKLLRLFRGELA